MSRLILAVEDQEDNMQILRDLLLSAGYEIIEAENGELALAAVAQRRPDLILMDIQIPIIDGYEVTRRIKADPALKSIPVIAVTSHAIGDGEEKAGRLAAMILWPSHTAHVSYWRRLANTCLSDCCGANGRYWH
jgi:two-component system cell cycle response regulator DivK